MLVRVFVFSPLLLYALLAVVDGGRCASAPKSVPSAQAKGGPRAQEFSRLHGQLNTLLGDLAGLQVKYRAADEEKRAEIQQQWKELIGKGEKMESKLIEAAQAAYGESPNADPQITTFLMNVLARQIKRDDYEPAAEIGKLLMDNKCAEKQLPNLAGIAAFAVSDFAAAERYCTRRTRTVTIGPLPKTIIWRKSASSIYMRWAPIRKPGRKRRNCATRK